MAVELTTVDGSMSTTLLAKRRATAESAKCLLLGSATPSKHCHVPVVFYNATLIAFTNFKKQDIKYCIHKQYTCGANWSSNITWLTKSM
jgi:hypothetical protein